MPIEAHSVQTHAPRRGLQVIRDEHASLGAVLLGLRRLLGHGPGDRPEAFFDSIRAMLFYIDEFPERQHHQRESDVLFPKLVRAAPETLAVVRSLELEHMEGHARVRELQHLLLAWELLGEARREEFAEAAGRYVDFYLRHMKVEETQLLPVAARVLSAADIAEVDLAFRADLDPLGPDGRRGGLVRLYARIVLHAPAPAGAGLA